MFTQLPFSGVYKKYHHNTSKTISNPATELTAFISERNKDTNRKKRSVSAIHPCMYVGKTRKGFERFLKSFHSPQLQKLFKVLIMIDYNYEKDIGITMITNVNSPVVFFFLRLKEKTKQKQKTITKVWRHIKSLSPSYLLQHQARSHMVPHGEGQRVQLKFLLIMWFHEESGMQFKRCEKSFAVSLFIYVTPVSWA